MAVKTNATSRPIRKKKTSIGNSVFSRVTHKSKKQKKPYRGQGRAK